MHVSSNMPRIRRMKAASLLTGVFLAGLLLPGPLIAQVAHYRLDPVHTRILVTLDHAGYSHAMGTASGSTGLLAYDPNDWTGARLEVQVPLDQLDFGDARWNRAVQAANLLDTRRHPHARFVSSHVDPQPDGTALVHGTLTLRGVSRPVTLNVTANALKRHPMPPFRRTAGFSATTSLQRADFGITAWPTMIGAEVTLRIEAEATLAPDATWDTLPPVPEAGDVEGTSPSEVPDTRPTPEADDAAPCIG